MTRFAIWGPDCRRANSCFPFHGWIIFHCRHLPINRVLFIHSSGDGRRSSFYSLAIMFMLLSTFMYWFWVNVHLQFSLVHTHKLNFWVMWQLWVQPFEGVPHHFPQQWNHSAFPQAVCEVSDFSKSLPTRYPPFPVFIFITTILAAVKWHLVVVLICIALSTNGVNHLFMYLLAS